MNGVESSLVSHIQCVGEQALVASWCMRFLTTLLDDVACKNAAVVSCHVASAAIDKID